MEHSTPSFTSLADLASARLGGCAIAANDEFFAPKSNLVNPQPAIFIPDKFTSRGKWMDGWESRRRRTAGHDWCVIRLGARGRIVGLDVDTSFFTGNHPSHCSIDALDISPAAPNARDAGDAGPWTAILQKSALRGDTHNYFETLSSDAAVPGGASSPVAGSFRPAAARMSAGAAPAWTYVRLNIYPDGGVARLRVYGEVVVDWKRLIRAGRPVDLAEIRHGGLVLGASDMHFGARDNLIMPGHARNMSDGWETRRRRGPGYDWAVVRLGTTGNIQRVEIDTRHFKGNYPDAASLEGLLAPGASIAALASREWTEILPAAKLKPHCRHVFSRELRQTGPVSHVRLNIFPDGGVSRLRVHGIPAFA